MAHSITLDPPQNQRSPEASMFALVIILVATSLVAGLGALASAGEADPWYAALNKAPGTPPGFVFGIVWPMLYAAMAVSAFMAWRGGARLGLFMLQLAVNLAWSYLFFYFHQPIPALVDIVVLWVLVFMMIRQFGRHSRLAGMLQVPYLLWLTFATYLNGWVVFAN
jgi:benzodiazapine receptor